MPDITYYLTRRVHLPPLTSQAAFDAAIVAQRRGRCIAPAGLRLDLAGAERRPAAVAGAPYREVPATLRAGRRRLRVDLELGPWSDSVVELGLRPRLAAGRPMPGTTLTDAGHDVLDRLADLLLAWADTPLVRVLAEISVDARAR